MTFILTARGNAFDLALANPAQIDIHDIAHALALINRFGGHTSRPYSVAEHSLHVCDILEDRLGVRHPAALIAALLHDAHEAYVGDMATPLKDAIGAAWAAVEVRIQHQVQCRFGVRTSSTAYRGAIKQADLMALATERRDLMPAGGPDWPCLRHVEPIDTLDLSGSGYDWEDWKEAFIDRFDELTIALEERRAGVRAA